MDIKSNVYQCPPQDQISVRIYLTGQNYLKVILFLNQFIPFKPGQFVSTKISLFQPRSARGKQKTQVACHKPQVTARQHRKHPKHSSKLTSGLIRPQQKFLGQRLASMNV